MGCWPCGVPRKPTARKLTPSRMPAPSARSDSRLLDDSFPPRNSPHSRRTGASRHARSRASAHHKLTRHIGHRQGDIASARGNHPAASVIDRLAGTGAMSNVIYPMSLVCRYRTKAEEKRRHAALMGKSDLGGASSKSRRLTMRSPIISRGSQEAGGWPIRPAK